MTGQKLFETMPRDESALQVEIERALGSALNFFQQQGVGDSVIMHAVLHIFCCGLIHHFDTNAEIIAHINKIMPAALDEGRDLYNKPEPVRN